MNGGLWTETANWRELSRKRRDPAARLKPRRVS
jgi:VanZ family protein